MLHKMWKETAVRDAQFMQNLYKNYLKPSAQTFAVRSKES